MNQLIEKKFHQGASATARIIEKGRKYLAHGDFDGIGRRPLFDQSGNTFPFFAVHAEGCRITDSSGNTYVDWINRWGPILLGYQHPQVTKAIHNQISASPSMTLMHPVQIEVAELLCEMIPSAEMAAFGKNGSDACCAAARLARAVTGREIIVKHGFHGFHDWHMITDKRARGVPQSLDKIIKSFPYNDIEKLETILKNNRGKVAAVMMEPVHMWMPKDGFLEKARDLAHQHGALFVFDEMVTSFRMANGGAQEFFGVTPDLTCLGKGMGNGMPLSALVGKREFMQHLPGCGIGMCFQVETLSLAVAKTVLTILKNEPVVEHIAKVGQTIRNEVDQIANRIGIDCKLVGPDARMTFVFDQIGNLRNESVRVLFQQECMRNGVLTNGSVLPNYANDDESVEVSLKGFEAGMQAVAKLIDYSKGRSNSFGGSVQDSQSTASQHDTVDNSQQAESEVRLPQFATGFIDKLARQNGKLDVAGWLFLIDGAADEIEFASESGESITATQKKRKDIQKAFSNVPNVLNSGFAAVLTEQLFCESDGNYRFTIIAKRDGKIAFRCLVRIGIEQTLTLPFAFHDGVLFV